MGNFYVNQTVGTSDRLAVASALRDFRAFISPAKNRSVVVCEQRADEQNIDWAMALSNRLSKTLNCPVLNVLNHDDEILFYSLHVNGAVEDLFQSSTGCYEDDGDEAKKSLPSGNASKLCAVFPGANRQAVETFLRGTLGDEYGVFAFQQHRALVEALGISDDAIGVGWCYVANDNLAPGLSKADFLEVTGEVAYQDDNFFD